MYIYFKTYDRRNRVILEREDSLNKRYNLTINYMNSEGVKSLERMFLPDNTFQVSILL